MGTGSGDGTRPAVLAGLLEAAPDAMVVIDAHGTIVIANGQAGAMFGYERDELAGQPIDRLVPAPVRDTHRPHPEAYVADPHVRPMGSGVDLQARRKDGSEFPVEISLAPLHSEAGLLKIGRAHV
jgi:PAS domain S-box-containing protein